jgi:RNA polymerase sigma factor (sigma-70 family)
MLREHRSSLFRVAARWSDSADDAEDALQRALEIYVRRLGSINVTTEVAWLKVVVRNEAIAVRRERAEGTALDESIADRVAAADPPVEERSEREERVARSVEALAHLKPDERTALLLQAEGFSYREIAERAGWTYTKVNRAVTEGRRRFRNVFARIESGEECVRFAPHLLALLEGAAQASDIVALRPHLRHCAACRASIRALQASRLRRLVLGLPFLAAHAPARWIGSVAAETGSPRTGQRHAAYGLIGRFNGSDTSTGIQLMSSGGGGRTPGVAAVLALCLGGGAGSYCLTTGGLPDPASLLRGHEAVAGTTPKPKAARAPRRAAPDPPSYPEAPAQRASSSRKLPVATSHPAQARGQATRGRRRAGAEQEFGFESVAGSSGGGDSGASSPAVATAAATDPAPARTTAASTSPPPTSGGEFLP